MFCINDTEHLKCILTFCFLQLSAFLYKTKSSSNPTVNALDLTASKINFIANNIAANPSFLSEGNYVNITEQYKGMCFIFYLNCSPWVFLTESSQSSQFKNGRLSCRKHNCSARSCSAVYVNLRHNRLCLPEYLPKRVFLHRQSYHPAAQDRFPLKLSRVEPGQYLDGRPPGKN